MDWFETYSFDNNKDRTKKLLEKFGIKKYHFITIDGIDGLIIEINLNVYQLEVDAFKEEIRIRKKRYTRKSHKHSKEYLECIKSFSNDATYLSLKFVAEDSGVYRT